MPIEATKDILSAIAFSCFAIKWAINWKTDNWFGHGFTVSSAIFAALCLAMAVSEIARA